jgi:hypothetical protein
MILTPEHKAIISNLQTDNMRDLQAGTSHSITIDLGESRRVMAVRLWNYNKAPEDAHRCQIPLPFAVLVTHRESNNLIWPCHVGRGVRLLHISVDGAPGTPACGAVVRKAPGGTQYDYGHTIDISSSPAKGWGMVPRSAPVPTAREMLR